MNFFDKEILSQLNIKKYFKNRRLKWETIL